MKKLSLIHSPNLHETNSQRLNPRTRFEMLSSLLWRKIKKKKKNREKEEKRKRKFRVSIIGVRLAHRCNIYAPIFDRNRSFLEGTIVSGVAV